MTVVFRQGRVRVEKRVYFGSGQDIVRRCNHAAIGELSAILQADVGDTRWVLRHVREQEKASRLAGFHRVSRTCHEMAEHADDTRGADRTRLLAVAATWLDHCRAIHMHAREMAKRAILRASERGREPEDDTDLDSTARPPPGAPRHVHWKLAGQAATS